MDRDLLLVPFSPSLAQGIEPTERAISWLVSRGFDVEKPLTFPKAGLTNIVHAMRADGLLPSYVKTQDAVERMWSLPAREVAR
jgi:hypothetical protein